MCMGLVSCIQGVISDFHFQFLSTGWRRTRLETPRPSRPFLGSVGWGWASLSWTRGSASVWSVDKNPDFHRVISYKRARSDTRAFRGSSLEKTLSNRGSGGIGFFRLRKRFSRFAEGWKAELVAFWTSAKLENRNRNWTDLFPSEPLFDKRSFYIFVTIVTIGNMCATQQHLQHHRTIAISESLESLKKII
jgi:hypothetical protein